MAYQKHFKTFEDIASNMDKRKEQELQHLDELVTRDRTITVHCPFCHEEINQRGGYCIFCGMNIGQIPDGIPEIHDNNPLIKGVNNPLWFVTLLLAIFTGFFGGHRFYNKKIGTGILMLITFGGFGWWYVIDLIMIITGNFKDKQGNKIQNTKPEIYSPPQSFELSPADEELLRGPVNVPRKQPYTDEEFDRIIKADIAANEALKKTGARKE